VTYETLLVDVADGVASVTLNRPDVRNALSATLLRGGALRYLRELVTLVALSGDAREGIKAFFEKRAPNWTGR
jgi:enoyl-CoA hydratase/carnithine racemase